MMPVLRSFLLLGLLSSGGGAQPPEVAPVRLTVSPAVAPRPALRYSLVPPSTDCRPGNAAVDYLRAATLRMPPSDETARWLETPVEQLPVGKLTVELKRHTDALAELDRAARCKRCDWQTDDRTNPEDIQTSLPALQATRDLSTTLRLRLLAELAENRFDPALRTLQTHVQLARHVAGGGTAIDLLVAYAHAGSAMSGVEDFLGRPAAPNLYWALSALPQPLVDPWPGLHGERRTLLGYWGDGWTATPLTATAATQALADTFNKRKELPIGTDTHGLETLTPGAVELTALVAATAPAARTDLIARGVPADRVAAMPAAQAVLARGARRYAELLDDQLALFALPPTHAFGRWDKITTRLAADRKDWRTDPVYTLMTLTSQPFVKIHAPFAKLQRQIDLLRTVEAVRLHIGETGRLPAKLTDVTAVPVPDDPWTGEAFRYTATDTTATLTAPARGTSDAVTYVLTVRR